MTSAFVGEAQSKGKDDPEDLFRVDEVVPGDKTAPAVSETGCTIQWPTLRELRLAFRSGAHRTPGSRCRPPVPVIYDATSPV